MAAREAKIHEQRLTGTLCGAKAIFLWGTAPQSSGRSSSVAIEGTRSESLERAKRKQTTHALPLCICMRVHMQVGLINSSFLGACGKQRVKLQSPPSSLCKHNYINLKRGEKKDLKHRKRLY